MKKPKPFATEVDLCAAFLAALPAGWSLVNSPDIRHAPSVAEVH